MEQKVNKGKSSGQSDQNSSQTFQKKIKHTTYVVHVHFSEESNAPSMEDK